ncbi:hypothetical protein CW755_18065 [Geobacillus thermodenitrificans]|nr:hypothetical protein CW755_18065 [Geobacillus thermodenitrificans]
MLVHREHLLGLFVSLLTFYRKGALFSIPFGFYWIINTPEDSICFPETSYMSSINFPSLKTIIPVSSLFKIWVSENIFSFCKYLFSKVIT